MNTYVLHCIIKKYIEVLNYHGLIFVIQVLFIKFKFYIPLCMQYRDMHTQRDEHAMPRHVYAPRLVHVVNKACSNRIKCEMSVVFVLMEHSPIISVHTGVTNLYICIHGEVVVLFFAL